MPAVLPDVEIRPVPLDQEVPTAVLNVLRELRTIPLEDEIRATLSAMAREQGYELHVAEVAGAPVGLVGFRPVRTLARGRHLRIDDLVVTRDLQGHGIGRRLLEHVESRAREEGLRAVYLDSPPEAVGYCTAQGYQPHTALLLRKRL